MALAARSVSGMVTISSLNQDYSNQYNSPRCDCGARLRTSKMKCRPCLDKQRFVKNVEFVYSGSDPEGTRVVRKKFHYTIKAVDSPLCATLLQKGNYYKDDRIVFDSSRVPAGKVKVVCEMDGYHNQEFYVTQQGKGMEIELPEWKRI